MIRFFIVIYLFFLSFIHTSNFDCTDIWYDSNNISRISNHELINIQASILMNIDSSKVIDLYIDNSIKKVRIDYDNQILILSKNESIKIFKNTNQLFIDLPDTILHNMIFSIFTEKYKYFNEDDMEFFKNKFLIKNQPIFNQIEVIYSNDCLNMESINLVSNTKNIYINKIDVKIMDNDNFFNFENNYFKYDLRYEN